MVKLVCIIISFLFIFCSSVNAYSEPSLLGIPVLKNTLAPTDGILYNEEQVKIFAHTKADLLQCATKKSLEEIAWTEQKNIYKQSLIDLQKDRNDWVEKAERGWFERNMPSIMFVGGVILGSLVSYGIYGISR